MTVELEVSSERRIRRPLILVRDHIPSRLITADMSSWSARGAGVRHPDSNALPLSPYAAGKFRWTEVTVVGTDA
ncbi:MAG: hypothetical protein U0S12_05030 [Fimbriimonadales bacterium]